MRGRSRYYKHSIMSNATFGELTIRNKDMELIIPQKYITLEGKIYQNIQKLIDKDNIVELKERGIKINNLMS